MSLKEIKQALNNYLEDDSVINRKYANDYVASIILKGDSREIERVAKALEEISQKRNGNIPLLLRSFENVIFEYKAGTEELSN